MADVFISHVEEDAVDALEIADALEAEGFSTWTYERDSIPGPSYLVQTGDAVEQSRAVVVLISRESLGSRQVTLEVVRGHEAEKPFIPVLIGITHVEFADRQPEWREAIGAATSVMVPREGVAAVTGRIADGLRALGVEASGEKPEHRTAFSPPPRRRGRLDVLRRLGTARKAALAAAVTGFVVLVAVLVAVVLAPGEDAGAPGGGLTPSSTGTGGTGAQTGALVTDLGDVRVSHAQLADEFCPPADFPGPCQKPTSARFLILTLEGWAGGLLSLDITKESNQSFVTHGSDRYEPSTVADAYQGVVRIVYDGVPATLAGEDVTLTWPSGQQIALQVER